MDTITYMSPTWATDNGQLPIGACGKPGCQSVILHWHNVDYSAV